MIPIELHRTESSLTPVYLYESISTRFGQVQVALKLMLQENDKCWNVQIFRKWSINKSEYNLPYKIMKKYFEVCVQMKRPHSPIL